MVETSFAGTALAVSNLLGLFFATHGSPPVGVAGMVHHLLQRDVAGPCGDLVNRGARLDACLLQPVGRRLDLGIACGFGHQMAQCFSWPSPPLGSGGDRHVLVSSGGQEPDAGAGGPSSCAAHRSVAGRSKEGGLFGLLLGDLQHSVAPDHAGADHDRVADPCAFQKISSNVSLCTIPTNHHAR